MQHTFLFEEGFWQLSGRFSNISGVEVPVEGRAIISHTPERWSNHAFMRIMTAQPQDIESVYTFSPIQPNATFVKWDSTSRKLGDISGCFAFVGDTIISSSIMAEAGQHATETLRCINDTTYDVRGTLFQNDTLVASWQILMHKIKHSEKLQ